MSKPSTTELDRTQDSKSELAKIEDIVKTEIKVRLYHEVNMSQDTLQHHADMIWMHIESDIKACAAEKVREARIDEREHTWKLINDIRYQNVSLDFAKGLSLERLSTLQVEQDMSRITALTPNTPKGEK